MSRKYSFDISCGNSSIVLAAMSENLSNNSRPWLKHRACLFRWKSLWAPAPEQLFSFYVFGPQSFRVWLSRRTLRHKNNILIQFWRIGRFYWTQWLKLGEYKESFYSVSDTQKKISCFVRKSLGLGWTYWKCGCYCTYIIYIDCHSTFKLKKSILLLQYLKHFIYSWLNSVVQASPSSFQPLLLLLPSPHLLPLWRASSRGTWALAT